jgi:hypothetical protein
MKIKDQLANTAQWVAKHAHAQVIPIMASKYFDATLFAFERREAWLELFLLFQKYGEAEAAAIYLSPFQSFLKKRWQRIQTISQLNYITTYKEPLTLACESLAEELQLGHRYELLFPGVNFFNENLGMAIAEVDGQTEERCFRQSLANVGVDLGCLILEKDIQAVLQQLPADLVDAARIAAAEATKLARTQLREFVIDDKEIMVHVEDCIRDAQADGILKHTNKLPHSHDNLNHLSSANVAKVIYHSKECKAYYDAVKKYWEARQHSYSFGGHLNRLVQKLTATGVRGTGSEENIDDRLLDGILEFYQFTKVLSQSELQMLYDLNSELGAFKTFKYYWHRLLQGFSYLLSDVELSDLNNYLEDLKQQYLLAELSRAFVNAPTSETPCTNLIAKAIDAMLCAKPQLYYIVPEHFVGLEVVNLLEAEENVSIFADKFQTAMKANNLTHYSLKDVRRNGRACTRLFYNDDSKLEQLCGDLVKDPLCLGRLLDVIDPSLQYWVLKQYCLPFIKSIIPTHNMLFILFNEFRNEGIQYAILKMFAKNNLNRHLRVLSKSFAAIYQLLQVAATPTIQDFILKSLGKSHIYYYIDLGSHLSELQALLPLYIYRNRICEALGEAQMRKLQQTTMPSPIQAIPICPSHIFTKISASGGNPLVFNNKRNRQDPQAEDPELKQGKRRIS